MPAYTHLCLSFGHELFSKRNNMYGLFLNIVLEFKDLGLFVSNNLSWNSQVNQVNRIVSKANRMLGLILRTCNGLFDVPTLKTLNCSVRSQLECSWVDWSPHYKRNIDLIDRVQRRATKLIFKSDLRDHKTRWKELNLKSLNHGRFIADVTFSY